MEFVGSKIKSKEVLIFHHNITTVKTMEVSFEQTRGGKTSSLNEEIYIEGFEKTQFSNQFLE